MEFTEQVYFRPWIGADYGKGSRWNVSLLLLGEAHYDSTEDEVTPRFTQQCIEAHASGKLQDAYWTNVMNTVLGESGSPSADERQAFWDSVAFYNYVQQMVGSGPTNRVAEQMWRDAEAPFLEVVRELEPECILVFGKKLWNELPEPDDWGPVVSIDNEQTETKYYGSTLAGRVYDPSGPGYSPQTWGVLAQEIIDTARKEAGK